MRNLTADLVFMPDGLRSGITLTIDDAGRILAVSEGVPPPGTEHHAGILAPGWVNAHCHLELSHLKGVIPRHTGLGGFGMQVVSLRGSASPEDMRAAATQQAGVLRDSGTVALGDISNLLLTASVKSASPLWFRTFVELISLDPAKAPAVLAHGIELLSAFTTGPRMRASLAAHAPYSVSQELMSAISGFEFGASRITSVHMLESPDEAAFLQDNSGPFAALYQRLGTDVSAFAPRNSHPVDWCSPLWNEGVKVQLVHNTLMDESTLRHILAVHPDTAFCFCPRANLYIENRLPDIPMFIREGAFLTLGTDSLASNDDLDLLNEMKTVQQRFPQVSLSHLLQWATWNGAKLLGFERALGSFHPGKTPGVNLLTGISAANPVLSSDTFVRVLSRPAESFH